MQKQSQVSYSVYVQVFAFSLDNVALGVALGAAWVTIMTSSSKKKSADEEKKDDK